VRSDNVGQSWGKIFGDEVATAARYEGLLAHLKRFRHGIKPSGAVEPELVYFLKMYEGALPIRGGRGAS